MPLTLTEAVCTAVLCLYAISTARAADSNPLLDGPAKSYEQAIARAEVLYLAAQDACEKAEAEKRNLCLEEAKTTRTRAIAGAKARLKAAQTVSYQHRDSAEARLESRL